MADDTSTAPPGGDQPRLHSRRALLAGAAAIPVMGAALALAPAAVSPDADLLAAVAELRRCNAEVDRTNHADVPWEAIEDAAADWNEAVEVISDLTATTHAGLRAKAQAFVWAIGQVRNVGRADDLNSPPDDWEWLGLTLAEDVLAVLGGGRS